MKLKKMFIKMVLWLKVTAFGLVLPAVVALSMVQSWKAVTIGLLALGLAVILGLNIIVTGKQEFTHWYISVLPV